MRSILESPWRATALGVALTAAATVVAMVATASAFDATTAWTMMVRALHLLAAMVWAGLIVFVNFVQLKALNACAASERPVIVHQIAGPTARVFTGAAHATLATGAIMLLPIGADVAHRIVLTLAVAGGVAMWVIVQFILRPNVARVTGMAVASDTEKAAARRAIATWARVNLVLVVPVTVAMLVAAHTGL